MSFARNEFFIYGCRVGGYLLSRELKSASFNATMKKKIKDGSPVFFRLQNGAGTDICCIVGVVIMACRLVV